MYIISTLDLEIYLVYFFRFVFYNNNNNNLAGFSPIAPELTARVYGSMAETLCSMYVNDGKKIYIYDDKTE